LTNFLDQTHTEGTSSGDIKGAVGVQILSINGNVYHVQHHWVTESGDTIYVKDAFLTAFPTSDPNRVLADYLKEVDIIGGTGRYDGAWTQPPVFLDRGRDPWRSFVSEYLAPFR